MRRLGIVLEMIKFEHTLFALPFAFLGAFLAARGFPGWQKTIWILLAMASARSAAMAFNRLVDRKLDSINPRTANRALPRKRVEPRFVGVFTLLAGLLFLFSAGMLNSLAFRLSPLALAIVLFYSFTKRWTSLSHIFLGLSLAIAPVGGWVAVTGRLDWTPFSLALAVLLWVSGFDIIYACQDLDFDREVGLFSFPSRLGIRKSLWISSLFHLLMVLVLAVTFVFLGLSFLSWIGLLIAAGGLIYEHRLVHPNDLSRVNLAFFTLNGLISVILFLFVGLDLCLS
ncbi:MAG: UbiA-like polyprenyltransferase [Acidobacteriota bacterium]